ncbi:MAG: glycosyltransferase family 4 protein, partial [Actinobacteria bacterium]|nr:glycosyltransferase family 4 protein [Actinomycetota bacterium]
MRLAVVVWEYPPHVVGGLGVYAGAMVPTLRAAGHLVDVFAAVRRDEPPAAPGVHWVRPLDLSPVYAGVFERAAANWGSFFGELFAANVLWAERVRAQDALAPYDLLVIHDWLSAPAGLILRATLRRPMVFHVHSTERGRQATAPSQLVDTWEETLGHQADAVITVSDAMREDLLARAWPADQLHAVWNGVDARIYHPGSAGGAAVRARYHIPATAPVV